MIYLISGAPRCGKTILAKRLASSHKLSWITTDALYWAFLRFIPETERALRLPGSRMGGDGKRYGFEVHPPEQLLAAEVADADTIWPGVKALIKHLIDCRQDYVIEGVHLLPRLVSELRGTPYWRSIRVVYLVKMDENLIRRGFLLNSGEYDWMCGAFSRPEGLAAAARMVSVKSRYFEKEAKRRRLSVVNTERGFAAKLREAARTLGLGRGGRRKFLTPP